MGYSGDLDGRYNQQMFRTKLDVKLLYLYKSELWTFKIKMNWELQMAMAQNYQPPKWMVFLLNMIISVGHWYHNFEPNPFGSIERCWFCRASNHPISIESTMSTILIHGQMGLLLLRKLQSGKFVEMCKYVTVTIHRVMVIIHTYIYIYIHTHILSSRSVWECVWVRVWS